MPTERFKNLDEKKKIKILKAIDIVISNQDINAVTVSDIVKEAKISRGSFYTYFDDIGDATEYLITQLSNEYINNFKKCIEDVSLDYWKGVKKFYTQQKKEQLSKNKKRLENIRRKKFVLEILARSFETKEYYSEFINFSSWCVKNVKLNKNKLSEMQMQILNLNVLMTIVSSFLIDKLHGDSRDTYIDTYISMCKTLNISSR